MRLEKHQIKKVFTGLRSTLIINTENLVRLVEERKITDPDAIGYIQKLADEIPVATNLWNLIQKEFK